jgi:acyl-CoA reductase-like NAD-dependent aldehyde dehydrogenase
VGAECGRQFKPMLLELGGSNVAIVMEDADLVLAAQQIRKGLTFLNGQWCMGVGRILVQEKIYDSFLNILLEELRKVEICKSGDPNANIEAMGPLAFAAHKENLTKLVNEMVSFGGKSHTSCVIPTDAGSCYFSPTILSEVPHDKYVYVIYIYIYISIILKYYRCSQAELFGPITSYHKFTTVTEAITKSNSCLGKLAAFIFSKVLH